MGAARETDPGARSRLWASLTVSEKPPEVSGNRNPKGFRTLSRSRDEWLSHTQAQAELLGATWPRKSDAQTPWLGTQNVLGSKNNTGTDSGTYPREPLSRD